MKYFTFQQKYWKKLLLCYARKTHIILAEIINFHSKFSTGKSSFLAGSTPKYKNINGIFYFSVAWHFGFLDFSPWFFPSPTYVYSYINPILATGHCVTIADKEMWWINSSAPDLWYIHIGPGFESSISHTDPGALQFYQ